KNLNVAIIETNDDYVYSGIGKTLELAGANVVNITTIKDKFLNENFLKDINNMLMDEDKINGELVGGGIVNLTERIISGESNTYMSRLKENDAINFVGNYNKPVDYIIIAGGAEDEKSNNILKVDKNIIETAK